MIKFFIIIIHLKFSVIFETYVQIKTSFFSHEEFQPDPDIFCAI